MISSTPYDPAKHGPRPALSFRPLRGELCDQGAAAIVGIQRELLNVQERQGTDAAYQLAQEMCDAYVAKGDDYAADLLNTVVSAMAQETRDRQARGQGD